ncbi:MAG: ATP-binding protein [Thermoplasmata archaeon]|nr:ATP-binding protein [Candidatus Sysuiplasma acidicola]
MAEPMRFYSLTLPQEVYFSTGEFIAKMAEGTAPFQFIIERNGKKPVELAVAARKDVADQLSYAVEADDYNSEIIPIDVLKNDDYHIGATLKSMEAAEPLQLNLAISYAMLALQDGEKLRVTLHVRPFRGLSSIYRMGATCPMSLTIQYSGSLQRLVDIFPLLRERKLWKVKESLKPKNKFQVHPFVVVDIIIPQFKDLIERRTIAAKPRVPRTRGNTPVMDADMNADARRIPFMPHDSFFAENILVFGGLRTGKTTLLCRLASNILARGRPVCLIDPRGDLVSKVMKTEGFAKYGHAAIFVDPVNCPVGLNPFELFRQPWGGKRISELISESIGYVVKTTHSGKFWEPRTDYLLQSLLLSTAGLNETNFVDMLELLNNPSAARKLADSTTDSTTRNFLLAELPRAREDWWMAVRDKIERVVLDEPARSVLCRRKGNVNLPREIRHGRSIVADINIGALGWNTAALISSILMSMFWVVASSLRTGATIIIDESHMLPPGIIQEIAADGRKFGVNIILASGSPTIFERSTLGGMSSHFRNIFTLRLGKLTAPTVARMLGTEDIEEIRNLPDLTALVKTKDGITRIKIEPLMDGVEEIDAAIERTKAEFGTEDDSLPSQLSSHKGKLFDFL